MAARSPRASSAPDVIRDRIASLPKRFRLEAANGLRAEWELRIGDRAFAVAVADHRCEVKEGRGEAPDAVLATDPASWLSIDEGTLSGVQAFLERRLEVNGNLDLAVRLQTLFRPYHRQRRAAELDQVELVADGVKLSCYVMGRGTPMVMLHGLGGGKVSLFPLMPELAGGHRLLVPDLPGHGESDKPAADYSPRFYARIVRHLMDGAGIDQAVVLGNSLGGRIALELALRSPGRVSALVLLDPAVPGFRWRSILGFTRVFPAEWGAIPFPLRERWMRLAVRRLFADPTVLSPEAYAAAADEFIRVYRDPAARVAFLSSLREIVTERPEPFFGALRRIKQPALVIFGEKDHLVPAKLGMKLSLHLPNGRLLMMPNVGHVPQFEATRATLDATGEFLSTVRASRARR